MVSLENCKDIAIKSFFQKVRTKPREKFLTKAKAYLRFFEVVFLGVPSHNVQSVDVYKKLV